MLRLRRATSDDCRRYWEWVNEPGVRDASFSGAAIGWDEHVAWFAARLDDPRSVLRVVEDDERGPVGQVRLDGRSASEAEIDISIAPEHRGQRFGVDALRLVCAEAPSGRWPLIVARVKAGNAASIRMFERAGFQRVEDDANGSVVRLEFAVHRVSSDE